MIDSLTHKTAVKVADEVWIATALLHREQPERQDFTTQEIRDRARREAIHGELRPGVYVHVVQHCVANRHPNPGRYRMLFATSKKKRRLFRRGDTYHPQRSASKTHPSRDEIPSEYRFLLDWYQQEYQRESVARDATDPILGLRGMGREIWQGVDPDAYVRQLRENWE